MTKSCAIMQIFTGTISDLRNEFLTTNRVIITE